MSTPLGGGALNLHDLKMTDFEGCKQRQVSKIVMSFDFDFFTLLVAFNTNIVFFKSLCARLNWQLACPFFSANHLSYRIVYSLCRAESLS